MDDIDYSKPFAVINGGEGYYVQGTVTEDLLDTFVPGMNISCSSWVNDSSIFCTAVVTEVSEYPTTNTRFRKYEAAMKIADNQINQALQNNLDLDTSLTALQKEITNYLNEQQV